MSADADFGLPAADRPMFLVSAAREILLANPAALAIFGASLETEMVPLAKILSPESSPGTEQLLSDFEKIPPVTALKFRAQDGSTRIFSASICPFNSGADVFFIFQLFPETVPAELADAADDAVLAQKQKLDCALQLARSVVLDFNNALTSILGHASLLLGKAEADHPWRRSLIEVEKSAARAAEIANELAVFSRHEKESRRMPPRSLNVMTQRCVEFFRSSDGAKVSWKIQMERELFGARFDEAKLQQALTKILENAVEAVARIQGQIVVQTRNVILTEPTQDLGVHLAVGNYVAVEISDNGGGIEPEDLPKIFEPFFTTKRAPHRGLGLALVYGIVANHGGGVVVSSRPGAGMSARIYLPAEKKSSAKSWARTRICTARKRCWWWTTKSAC